MGPAATDTAKNVYRTGEATPYLFLYMTILSFLKDPHLYPDISFSEILDPSLIFFKMFFIYTEISSYTCLVFVDIPVVGIYKVSYLS